MSTTIYTAYRIPMDRLNDFKSLVLKHQMPVICEHVYKLVSQVTDGQLALWAQKNNKTYTPSSLKAKIFHKIEYVFEDRLIPAAQDRHRNPSVDIECGWNLYFDSEYAYVTPWGEPWTLKDFHEKRPDWVRDFCYWNNSDSTPEGIEYGDDEWEARSDKWDELLSGHNWRVPFRLDIVRLTNSSNYLIRSKIEDGVMAIAFGQEVYQS